MPIESTRYPKGNSRTRLWLPQSSARERDILLHRLAVDFAAQSLDLFMGQPADFAAV